MELKYYEVTITDNKGWKKVLIVTLDDEVKHIYTIDVTSDQLCKKRPVNYGENIKRVLSRLSAKDHTNIYRIPLDDALLLAYEANRTSVAVSILKKLRAYRRRREDLKDAQKSTQESL